MRLFTLAAIGFVALAAPAWAQETTTAAAAPPPPASSCPAFTPAPEPPSARANATQMNAALATYEAWRTLTQSTVTCRVAEQRALVAQANARELEIQAASTANAAAATAWQTQLDAYHARQRR